MSRNGTWDRRIRVAHVSLNLNMGGAEKLLVEFARHVDRRRFELRFVALGQRGNLAEEVEAHGWPVTALEEPEGLRAGLVFRLRKLLRQWGADVVHTHNTKPLLYAAPAAWLARVPVVIHTRHGRGFHASRRETAAFRILTRLVDRVVCVSKDSASLSEAEGITPHKICTIWNGIDASRFDYRGPREGGPAVMVGRLNPVKDVETLIRAVPFVLRECPAFHLEIAGEGECLPALKELTGQLGLREHVHFLGEIRDIPELLARASLLVLSSVSEGISLTLLEAMARGLPVVATHVGGNPEVVIDEENGYLVPSKEPARLAGRIVDLIRQPDLARRMGQRGRERVLAHFQISRMVAQYETLYEEFLRGRGTELTAKAVHDPDPII